ncbi:streptomycin 6-kinase [Microlunatus aurantiacus]|uniref:Streptomycin 6-kinase n=1 Tax=Microlunatus aurantiacus TaxID=446786 RepID=A0ABP7D2E6_9ACTN
MVDVPAALRARAEGRPSWDDWLARAPRLSDDLIHEWRLRVDGPTLSGNCAMVVPVRTDDGREAVLKLTWPHWEAETEHLALRAWQGDGAVELWRADPRRFALLLERASVDRDLHALGVLDACEVVAGLYRRLHVDPLPQTRRLSDLCREWLGRLPVLLDANLISRRFVSQAERLLRDFAGDPETDLALIHSDLHYFNVLAAEREPWLAIDPKPLAGDPGYEVGPLLGNRWDEIMAAASPRQALLDRLFTVVDVAGLDEDRVRDWVVVREVCNVLWTYEEHLREGAAIQHDWVTAATTIIKAVQR